MFKTAGLNFVVIIPKYIYINFINLLNLLTIDFLAHSLGPHFFRPCTCIYGYTNPLLKLLPTSDEASVNKKTSIPRKNCYLVFIT